MSVVSELAELVQTVAAGLEGIEGVLSGSAPGVSFTPSLRGSDSGSPGVFEGTQTGWYKRVAPDLCYCEVEIYITAVTTPAAGSLRIACPGLPHIDPADVSVKALSVATAFKTGADYPPLVMMKVIGGETTLILRVPADNDASAPHPADGVAAGCLLAISGTYRCLPPA